MQLRTVPQPFLLSKRPSILPRACQGQPVSMRQMDFFSWSKPGIVLGSPLLTLGICSATAESDGTTETIAGARKGPTSPCGGVTLWGINTKEDGKHSDN